jgi:hypothetical protein
MNPILNEEQILFEFCEKHSDKVFRCPSCNAIRNKCQLSDFCVKKNVFLCKVCKSGRVGKEDECKKQ